MSRDRKPSFSFSEAKFEETDEPEVQKDLADTPEPGVVRELVVDVLKKQVGDFARRVLSVGLSLFNFSCFLADHFKANPRPIGQVSLVTKLTTATSLMKLLRAGPVRSSKGPPGKVRYPKLWSNALNARLSALPGPGCRIAGCRCQSLSRLSPTSQTGPRQRAPQAPFFEPSLRDEACPLSVEFAIPQRFFLHSVASIAGKLPKAQTFELHPYMRPNMQHTHGTNPLAAAVTRQCVCQVLDSGPSLPGLSGVDEKHVPYARLPTNAGHAAELTLLWNVSPLAGRMRALNLVYFEHL